MDRVMALSMRPRSLCELVGQDDLLSSLATQFATGRIPHFYVIAGPVGAGKTTLARILALMLQSYTAEELKDAENLRRELPWGDFAMLNIMEINAANKNGVDDVRCLVDAMRYQPMAPSRVKVAILDEAHQLTPAAQNALLTETEDVHRHVFYIFCTSASQKLLPALQRRAYFITPRPLAETPKIEELLELARTRTAFSGDLKPLVDILTLHDVTSPGLIMQAAERFFSGLAASESVILSSAVANPKLDVLGVCRSIAAGKWKDCAEHMRHATRADVAAARATILGFLRTQLLRSSGAQASRVSMAINSIASTSTSAEECALPSLLASVCIACVHMSGDTNDHKG